MESTSTRPRATRRSNREWIAALRGEGGPERAEALDELRAYLARALGRALRDQRRVRADDLSDFVQETLLRLVERLPTFRGDSAFTTWATAIATRVAFTELRRRGARERGREELDRIELDAAASGRRGGGPADEELARRQLLEHLQRAIETELSERQRIAVLAELRGLPTIEIAERLGTNQNALYKLTHDARVKLRAALLGAGFSAEEIREQVGGGAR